MRRFIGGLIRICLVFLAVFLVGRYFSNKKSSAVDRHLRVETKAPPPNDSLGPGDLRIYNADSSVDLVLVGDKILAGLSPKTIATVKRELDSNAKLDTSGLGGSISSLVKKTVAGAIGTHAAFPLTEVNDIRYERQQIVFDWNDGKQHPIVGDTKFNGKNASKTFSEEDAQRFIQAVKARKAQLPVAPR